MWFFSGTAEAAKHRLLRRYFIKPVRSVEIIEQLKLSFIAETAGHTEKTIRFQPEIIGGKIIYSRIYQQNFRLCWVMFSFHSRTNIQNLVHTNKQQRIKSLTERVISALMQCFGGE